MSFSSYPTYKDSKIEWLSSIHVDWLFSKLKFVTTCNDEVLPENFDPEEEINYIEISDVSLNLGVTNLSTLAFGVAPSRARRVVRHGDILISTVRTYLKAIAQVTYPEPKTIASTGFAVIRPKESYSTSGFLKHLAHAEGFIGEVISRSTGVSYPAINASELISIDLPLPPINEQTQIVRFLDHEVGKIDALIAEQEKLIALLKEKRQAVISHAVTKGLNPDAPMKDSGVEWLGQVPEHWEIKRVKNIFRLTCEASDDDHGMELLSVYSDIGVRPRREMVAKGNKATDINGYWLVKSGDLVVNKLLAWMGAVGYSAYDGVTSPAYDILRPINKVNSKFYHYLFRDPIVSSEFKRWSRGIMEMRLRLYFDELGGLPMPFPPITEQNAVVEEIEAMETKFGDLITEAESVIELSKERRSALISAAVTGKIDVRGWQPPAAQ